VQWLYIDFKKGYNSVRREVLYNILIQSGIPIIMVRLRKMCLNETSTRVWVGKWCRMSIKRNESGFMIMLLKSFH